ncbi:MAG: hypothetical protein ACFFER_15670 [Candidatus Thorarchaeota archaeon]
MSVILFFGAGASYGAGSVYPKPPPLGAQLYNELRSRFPKTWGHFPQALHNEFAENFEKGMGVLWQSGSHASPVLMQDMAVYFSEFTLSISRDDCYSTLVDLLVSKGLIEDCVFSTLNYDCLLEIALSMAKRRILYFNRKVVDSSDSIMWKLHGSCNFIPENIRATRGVSFGSSVTWNPDLRAVNPPEVKAFCYGNTALYPALAIYAKDKPVQIAPGIIRHIQNWWAEAIAQSSQIVVVGVNPYPDDNHIWNPIATSSGRLLYVGNEKAFKRWSAEYRSSNESIHLGNRFNLCIERIIDELQ